jgi:hypothetical protein
METLHECMFYVKGCEYVVAALFLTGFVVFWQLLSREGHVQEERHAEERPAMVLGEWEISGSV